MTRNVERLSRVVALTMLGCPLMSAAPLTTLSTGTALTEEYAGALPATMFDEKDPVYIRLSAFLYEGHGLPQTRADTIARFGTPKQLEVEDPKKEFEGKSKSEQAWAELAFDGVFRTLKYDGFAVSYYEHDTGEGYMSAATITSSSFSVVGGIGVGASTSAVVQYLGTPTELSSDSIIFRPANSIDGTLGEVVFRHRRGVVDSISWAQFEN